MTKITTLTAVMLCSTAAFAADLPRPRPDVQVPLAPAWSWSGAYIGGSVGYGRSDASNRIGDAFNTVEVNTNPKGALGGLYAGYNWQFGYGLLGIETDASWSGIKGTNTVTGKIDTRLGAPEFWRSIPYAVQYENRLTWLGTTRVRGGVAFGPTLLYATGGLAYGGVESNVVGSYGSSSLNSSFAQSFNNAETRVGWAAGGGVEYAVTSSMLARVEYLHYDLGKTLQALNSLPPVTTQSSNAGDIVRAGVAFKF